MSLEGASGSTLDAELSKILKSFTYARQNSDSLQEASTRRRKHREVLLDWLSSHFRDGQLFPADSSFIWINDIIATNCTDKDDLEYVADLLIEREYDSPWIIHDNGDALQRKVDSRETSKISLKWHSPHCGHIYDSEASNDIRKQNHLNHTWDNLSSKFDCLGLAGFLPLKSRDADPDLRHESQLRQWEAHVRIDGNTADVSYISEEVIQSFNTNSPFKNYSLLRELFERIDLALSNALAVISLLQQNGRCCDRLTFLRQGVNQGISKIPPALESSYIPLELVIQFADSVKNCQAGSKAGPYLPFTIGASAAIAVVAAVAAAVAAAVTAAIAVIVAAISTFSVPGRVGVDLVAVSVAVAAAAAVAAINTISVSRRVSVGLVTGLVAGLVAGPVAGPVAAAVAVGAAASAAAVAGAVVVASAAATVATSLLMIVDTVPNRERRIHNLNSLPKPVCDILNLLGVSLSWPSLYNLNEPFMFLRGAYTSIGQQLIALHMTALATQFLCLVVQSYAQAHTGGLAFTFLDTPISFLRLSGAGLMFQGRGKMITATLQRLTCLGGMTRNKVMVFAWEHQLGSLKDSVDLVTTPRDLVDLWGPSSFVSPNSNLGNLGEDIHAICIGGGIVHPQVSTNEQLRQWHWSPGPVSKLLQDGDISDAIDRGPHISMDSQICIGANVPLNESCPLTQPEVLKHVQKQFQECFHLIGTSESRWALETVQAGAQIGQYGVPQFMFGWRKLPGVTIKQKYLSGNNPTLVNDLAQPWGLHVSLCTGVIARVRLQQVLATCINLFMSQRNPIMLEWEVLRDRHEMVEALQNKDLGEWMGKLPGNYAKIARNIIEELLTRLLPTGVDAENKLVVSWMHENSTLECLKIPCKGHNLWAQILSDSADLATIACITPSCLESPCHTNRRCQYLIYKEATSFQQRKSFEFLTSVKPFVLNYDDSMGTSWTLQINKSYWIGRIDSMLLADVSKSPTGTPILSVRKSTMALSMYKRLRAKRMLRETNAEGAQHCVIISGGPVV